MGGEHKILGDKNGGTQRIFVKGFSRFYPSLVLKSAQKPFVLEIYIFLPLCGEEFSIFSLIFPDHWSIVSGNIMLLATMRQMMEIGETEASLNEKELSALLQFQISP